MSSEKTEYHPSRDDLKASDVLKLAGLTYRQLHDWEERAGIIQSERVRSDTWRRFTFEEVMALAVCARIRESFDLSLERTRLIYRWLVGKQTTLIQEQRALQAERTLHAILSAPELAAVVDGGVTNANAQECEIMREY